MKNDIGHFMIGVGGVIEHTPTGKILILRRTSKEHLTNQWELMYGRIDQFEELEEGLRREVKEEAGITDLTIKKMYRIWHIMRGEKKAENDLYGFSFYCQTNNDQVILSPEHSEYRWVTPQEALEYITREGIRQDVEVFIQYKDKPNGMMYSDLDDELVEY